jgi:hypothetical protein
MKPFRPSHIFSTAIIVALVTISNVTVFSAGIDDMQRGFVDPPTDARIMMRWWWFGPAVTKPEIERELRVMKDAGIGGVEVQPVYPLLPDDPAAGRICHIFRTNLLMLSVSLPKSARNSDCVSI